jgi:hypothetical protein
MKDCISRISTLVVVNADSGRGPNAGGHFGLSEGSTATGASTGKSPFVDSKYERNHRSLSDLTVQL